MQFMDYCLLRVRYPSLPLDGPGLHRSALRVIIQNRARFVTLATIRTLIQLELLNLYSGKDNASHLIIDLVLKIHRLYLCGTTSVT